jgi:hypothetical protein
VCCQTEDNAQAYALSSLTFKLFDDLRAEVATDPVLVKICQEILDGRRYDGWAIVDNLITHHGRVFISATSQSLRRP